ncbi:LEA type 2 family protein [Natrialbaceae archaeon GCM10025810]|uniref:LEA type 2 family protein n=1 Tax=Halovalidus salilacus TaxID=3075124 RepID=UPI00361F72AB
MVRRRTWLAILVVLVLLGTTAAYGVLAVDRPRVESIDNDWGTVTDERTEVVTEVTIDNPLLLRYGDAGADVSYTVSLNDVEVANERERRVDLDGDDTVTVSTWIDNDDIPAWWASHVNNDETTTVRVEPDIIVDVGGVGMPAEELTRTRTVRTDLLEPLETNESQPVRAAGRTAFVVHESDARWGNATVDRTPIEASASVTNELSTPVPITQIGYTVELNGVVVGQGVAADRTVLEPESNQTITANATIDNSKLDEWWVTHRRNDGSSNMTVDFNATVEYAGVERTVPLEFISYERTFRTDLFEEETEGTTDASNGEDGRRGEGRASAANGVQVVGDDPPRSSG